MRNLKDKRKIRNHRRSLKSSISSNKYKSNIEHLTVSLSQPGNQKSVATDSISVLAVKFISSVYLCNELIIVLL